MQFYCIGGSGGPGGPKTSQYLVWPPFASCSATRLLHIELIRLLIVTVECWSTPLQWLCEVAGYWQEPQKQNTKMHNLSKEWAYCFNKYCILVFCLFGICLIVLICLTLNVTTLQTMRGILCPWASCVLHYSMLINVFYTHSPIQEEVTFTLFQEH